MLCVYGLGAQHRQSGQLAHSQTSAKRRTLVRNVICTGNITSFLHDLKLDC